jgi:hypothetical protein
MLEPSLGSALVLALAVGSPWIVGIVLLLRRLPRDGFVPPSFGAQLRDRLLR